MDWNTTMRLFNLFVCLSMLTACANQQSGTAPEGERAKAVAEALYAAVSAGDADALAGLMAPDIVWNEAEGHPYADLNPYIGPEAVLTGLFSRLGGEWDGFTAAPEEYVVEGSRVVVFGRYSGAYKATGGSIDASFVHDWTVENGRMTRFQQYTDTAELVAVMTE